MKNTYIENQFELPLAQRNGLEYLNIKGVESSNMRFEKAANINLDSFKPIIAYE